MKRLSLPEREQRTASAAPVGPRVYGDGVPEHDRSVPGQRQGARAPHSEL